MVKAKMRHIIHSTNTEKMYKNQQLNWQPSYYQHKMFANNNVLKVTTVKTQFTIINCKVQLLTAF